MTQALGVPKWGTDMAHSQHTSSATCALGCPAPGRHPRHHVGVGVCPALRRNPSATYALGLPAHRYQPKRHVCAVGARQGGVQVPLCFYIWFESLK